jgi:hypothetical protein
LPLPEAFERRHLAPGFVTKAPKPSKDRAFYWVAKQSGFGLMVTASGHSAAPGMTRFEDRE